MSAIPEPIISEKEPLEIVNDTLAKKTKIIKRKSPKSTNTLRNLGSLKTSSLTDILLTNELGNLGSLKTSSLLKKLIPSS